MTLPYATFEQNIKNHFYYYVHYNTGWELLYTAFNNQAMQLCFNKSVGQEHVGPWLTFQRFHSDRGELWTPRFEVEESKARVYEISNFLNAHMLGVFFNDFDQYLHDLLHCYERMRQYYGSHWSQFEDAFKRVVSTPLANRPNGGRIFAFMELRHKIQHNNAVIDQKFINRMAKAGIDHNYQVGDKIKLGIQETLNVVNELLSFAKSIDCEIEQSGLQPQDS